MYDVLDVPHASQICLLNGVEMQCAEFFCRMGIFIVSSPESSAEPPGRYQGDSAAIPSILARSLAATFTSSVCVKS
jgi:hypothetical protein